MIDVKDIKKSFGGVPVLNGVSLRVNANDCACVIGRNGCGKSTLLNIISGMTTADSGGVTANCSIGYAPQNDILFNDLSVSDNLKFWAKAAGVKGNIWDAKCVRLLDIEQMRKKKIKNLSGGMRRRVCVAVAIIKNPDCLILDEPFAGLDVYYKSSLTDFLQKFNAIGKTIIFTSHSADETIALCNKLYLIQSGRIVFEGQKDDAPALFEQILKGGEECEKK